MQVTIFKFERSKEIHVNIGSYKKVYCKRFKTEKFDISIIPFLPFKVRDSGRTITIDIPKIQFVEYEPNSVRIYM